MVFHDRALDRLTGVPGLIVEHDVGALACLRLRGGPDHVPTLAELLATIDGRVPLVIEIKSEGDSCAPLTDRTLAVLEDYPGTIAVESFDPHVIRHCREQGTLRPLGLVGPPAQGELIDLDALKACDFVSWSVDQIGEMAERYPALPRSCWTVRTHDQERHARRHDAQIVFEGFTPSPSVNRDAPR